MATGVGVREVRTIQSKQQHVVDSGPGEDALGSALQVHVGKFWGLVGWNTFLVSDLGKETGFGLIPPS